MNIVLFVQPRFLHSHSMQKFAAMLAEGCRARGHHVDLWEPEPWLHALLHRGPWRRWAKWGGYVDQYIVFPHRVRRLLRQQPHDTLYVFTDQALGPWVPLVRHKPHVVHAHDLLALRSALGCIEENQASFTGRLYQRFIRRGFQQAHRFIAISERTRADLQQFAAIPGHLISVVHNGLNHPFRAMSASEARGHLLPLGIPPHPGSFLIGVGGGAWYKNTKGLFAMYAAYAQKVSQRRGLVLPLVLVTARPDTDYTPLIEALPDGAQVLLRRNLSPEALNAAYAMSAALVFPSLAEGFGWPIVEAQACGTLVLTTDDAPMNEIGGPSAFYLRRLQASDHLTTWAQQGADLLHRMLSLPPSERAALVAQGAAWTRQFDANDAIDAYLAVYQRIGSAMTPATPPRFLRRILQRLGHQEWLRFGVRDRIIRFFHHPDTCPSEGFTVPFHGGVYRGNFNTFIDWSTYYYGSYSGEELRLMGDLLKKMTAPVFVDVGANIGHHTLFAALKARQVLAFEPFQEVADRLSRKVQDNRLRNVRLFQHALGNQNQEANYTKPDGHNTGTGSFSPTRKDGEVIPLSVKVGDEVFDEHRLGDIDFVKIDTEGYEPMVLEGLKQTLTRNRPVVFFEWTQSERHQNASEQSALFPQDYRFFHFIPHTNRLGLFRERRYRLKALQGMWPDGNLLAVPQEKERLLGQGG